MENEEKITLFTSYIKLWQDRAFTQYVAKAAEDKEGISDDIVSRWSGDCQVTRQSTSHQTDTAS